MKTQDQLAALGLDHSSLAQFTGTLEYHRIGRRHLLTDGTRYLSERAQCWWIMDAVASHLDEIGTDLIEVAGYSIHDPPALRSLA